MYFYKLSLKVVAVFSAKLSNCIVLFFLIVLDVKHNAKVLKMKSGKYNNS